MDVIVNSFLSPQKSVTNSSTTEQEKKEPDFDKSHDEDAKQHNEGTKQHNEETKQHNTRCFYLSGITVFAFSCVILALEVVTILIIGTDLVHMNVPGHKTTVVVCHVTDVVPHHPPAIGITTITVTTVVIAAAVEMIDVTAHRGITIIDIIPLLIDITITITMAAAIITIIITKNTMTSLLVAGESHELIINFISFCNKYNSFANAILNLQSTIFPKLRPTSINYGRLQFSE